jgi:hypothetical protein
MLLPCRASHLRSSTTCAQLTEIRATILAWEGPILRAYLAAVKHFALRVERILLITPRCDVVTGKPVGRWLPVGMRDEYARRIFESRMNYWPRRLQAGAKPLFHIIHSVLSARFAFFDAFSDALHGSFRYAHIASNVSHLLIQDLADPALENELARATPSTVIYTGGGLVPKRLLAIPGMRFLHVHPGLLPHVGGADGLLWSTLIRGRPGRSAFWMTPQLDAGPICMVDECEPVSFPIEHLRRPDDRTLYRAVYSFYDPCLRAELLARMLASSKESLAQQARATEASGIHPRLFPFMSNALRNAALRKLFPDKRADR